LEAEICLCYKNEREAQAVAQAVSPDNIEVPTGLSLQTSTENSKVCTNINCEKSLQTLIATLDDLLACISVAEKAFKVINNNTNL